MVSQATQPLLVEAEVTAVGLEATALRSEDGKRTTIRVLNRTGEAITCDVRVQGLRGRGRAMVRTLAAPLEAANSASDPNAVAPVTTEEAMRDGAVRRTFPPTSFTVMQVR
jgi:alpha-L-arabinofuranosidase